MSRIPLEVESDDVLSRLFLYGNILIKYNMTRNEKFTCMER